ncbi:MAG TPA: hypothetical protein VFL51_16985 [Pseudolabrys sp.]|nr:hypothetical protein [Pseudolabrys sp.]
MDARGRQVEIGDHVERRGHAARNLVLVHEPFVQDRADLEAIAHEIHAAAPDIEVFVASNDTRSSTSRRQASRRPTLVYSPTELRSFQPLRGKIYAGALIPKHVQLRRLAEAGVPVPDFALLQDNFEVDADRFGPVAMLKSTGLTSHGRGMEMAPAAALAGLRWRDHPMMRATQGAPTIVQTFVDTGEYPSHYRILTLFGEPIFGFRAVSTVRRPSLDAPAEALASGPFMARHGQRRLIIPVEPDVLALARRTFDAIPEVALHGVDIIRDAATGRLFVLEINPGGNTWSFSSKWAALLRTELNVSDLAAHFDAWKTCARVLIDRTRAEAI